MKLWRLDVEGAVKRDFADDVHEFDVERWQNVKQFKHALLLRPRR